MHADKIKLELIETFSKRLSHTSEYVLNPESQGTYTRLSSPQRPQITSISIILTKCEAATYDKMMDTSAENATFLYLIDFAPLRIEEYEQI